MKTLRVAFAVMAVFAFTLAFGARVEGQLGRQQGLLDANIAVEKDLLAQPHLNATIVKGLIERRPFLTHD